MNKYVKLKLDFIKPNLEINFDLFVYLPSKNKFIKYISKNSVISEDKIDYFRHLNKKQINQLFISRSDFEEFKLNNPQISDDDILENEEEIKLNNIDEEVKDKKFGNIDNNDEEEINKFNNIINNNEDQIKLNNDDINKEQESNEIIKDDNDVEEDKSKNFENTINKNVDSNKSFSNFKNTKALKEDKIKDNKENQFLINNKNTNDSNINESQEYDKNTIFDEDLKNDNNYKSFSIEDLDKFLKNDNVEKKEKDKIVEGIIKAKEKEEVLTFSNIIKNNIKYYEYNQLDDFINKSIENKQKKEEKENKKINKIVKESINKEKLINFESITEFKPYINKLFLDFKNNNTKDIEKILLDFTEFLISVLQVHDDEEGTISLSKDINEICSYLSIEFSNHDYLVNHAIIVSVVSCSLALILESSDTRLLKDLCIGGIFHDLGFINLDINTLVKTINKEELSSKEDEIYKKHPNESYDILVKLPKVSLISDIVIRIILEHHENPKGFPKQKSIMTQAMQVKIISICDKISHNIQNKSFKDFKTELNSLLELQEELGYKMYDIKLIKQVMEKL